MQATTSYRLAQKTFHCYQCDKQFKKMTNVDDYSDVRCPTCDGDFFEEAKYIQQDQQSAPQAAPQPAPQPQPQQPQRPQAPLNQPSSASAAAGNIHFNVPPGMSHQQTFSQRFSPRSGWTQSVTISVNGQPGQSPSYQVHQTSTSMPNQRPNFHAHQFQQQSQAHQMPGFSVDDYLSDFLGPHISEGNLFGGASRGFPQNLFGAQGAGNIFFFDMPMGQQVPSTQGLSPDEIANLPEKPKEKKSDCYICLEPCKDGKESVQLPCEHAFDRLCIEGWLKDHDSCPACRKKINEREASPRSTFLQ